MGYQNVSFVTESITKIPFENESFDAVFSYGDVVSHIREDYENAIGELARVARPGGLVSFEVDNKWNFNLLYHPLELWDAMTHWRRGHDSRIWNGMCFKTFTYPELQKILTKYNLKPLEFHGHNIFASLVPDRFALEEGERSIFGELALWLGKLDQPLSGIFPFYRLGYNIVVVTQKS
jgi:ubiquinone/menaquinone biosynthesis C-methylase UbiE